MKGIKIVVVVKKAFAIIEDGSMSVPCRSILTVYDIPVFELKKGKKTNRVIDRGQLALQFKNLKKRYGKDITVFIEKAQTMPAIRKDKKGNKKQGIASSGKYMMSYGIIIGILCGLEIKHEEVHPRTWKKVMMPDMDKQSKDASRYRAGQLFPDNADDFKLKKHHNRAEAALIAEYGKRVSSNQ